MPKEAYSVYADLGLSAADDERLLERILALLHD